MSVCCDCCVLSGRGLCNELISRPEESYRVCVSECDREASTKRGGPGCRAIKKGKKIDLWVYHAVSVCLSVCVPTFSF
jgi:hypothetical protein